MAAKPIRVLIIDDSRFFREFMSRTLSLDISTEVVGVVGKAQEAYDAIRLKSPNIITLDIEIKDFGYRDFIQRIRREHPQIPIIVISPLSSHVFDALKAGAVDFVSKPNAQMHVDNAAFMKDVLAKIKTVYSGAMSGRMARPTPPVSTTRAPLTPPPRPAASSLSRPASPPPPAARPKPSVALPKPPIPRNVVFPPNAKRIIAIGASTGGTEAILSVVRELPANTPGIVIVQHMPPVFTKMYAERLDKACQMTVREAKHGDRVQPGLILVAEGSQQMRVVSDARGYFVKVDGTDKVSGHCPSVDVLFDSVATTAGEHAVGVILTGMGGDGAKNLLKMREAGAYTIGQDEATCVVYGMPMVAFTLGAVVDQLPLDQIPGAIVRYLTK